MREWISPSFSWRCTGLGDLKKTKEDEEGGRLIEEELWRECGEGSWREGGVGGKEVGGVVVAGE